MSKQRDVEQHSRPPASDDALERRLVIVAYEDERSWTSVHAAAWDFEKAATRLSEDGGQLIALVKTRPSDSELRLQMGLLNNLASVVDVGPVQQAASRLTRLLHAGP